MIKDSKYYQMQSRKITTDVMAILENCKKDAKNNMASLSEAERQALTDLRELFIQNQKERTDWYANQDIDEDKKKRQLDLLALIDDQTEKMFAIL